MTLSFRAHFDGRVFVPDEPVDLPINQPLVVQVSAAPEPAGTMNGGPVVDPGVIEERLRRLRAFAGRVSGPVLSDEALRREAMYDDRP